jgi:hypothetical protein
VKETFRLIRVFLASPGDLQNERKLANAAVDELNKGIATHLGFRVELKGWEDTLPGLGRPQAIINKELDRCELFIGIMWKKWGTPPATVSPYSSGFEEEFERSSERVQRTNMPEMAMYFKAIPADFLTDPGEDLQKVIAFKQRIISEKIILFGTFNEPDEFQKCVREKITEYLIRLNKNEQETLEERETKPKDTTQNREGDQPPKSVKSPFSIEGHRYLENILAKTVDLNKNEELTSFEVARFRLLSSTVSRPGNDRYYLGTHDSNIIYLNKTAKFGKQEISKLIDGGLKNIGDENTPLWYWCSIDKNQNIDELLSVKSVIFLDDPICTGALEAMKLIGSTLPIISGQYERSSFIKQWLSKDSSELIKLAALKYLKHHGKHEDLALVQAELDTANSKTSRISLETILSIQLRHAKGNALETAVKSDFEIIDEFLLKEILSGCLLLDDTTLKSGLKHKNKYVRLECLATLIDKKKLDSDEMKFLLEDQSALIRKRVIEFILSEGKRIEENTIKSILVKPDKDSRNSGLLGGIESDEGQRYFDEYLHKKFLSLPEDELRLLINEEVVIDYIPYFALCTKCFKKYSDDLRKNIDDHFKQLFICYIESLKRNELSAQSIGQWERLEEFVRKQLTRKGLDVLCKHGAPSDILRIRKNLFSDYVNSSKEEILYMGKFGEWSDIPFIVKAKEEYTNRSILSGTLLGQKWNFLISSTIYHIGRDRLDELLNIEMPSSVLIELVKGCSMAKFSELSNQLILSFLNHKESSVRRVFSLKALACIKKSRIISLLKEYIVDDKYRYYNTIYWLDLGASIQSSKTKRAALFALNE